MFSISSKLVISPHFLFLLLPLVQTTKLIYSTHKEVHFTKCFEQKCKNCISKDLSNFLAIEKTFSQVQSFYYIFLFFSSPKWKILPLQKIANFYFKIHTKKSNLKTHKWKNTPSYTLLFPE
jgi:hypothetical protein